MNSPEFSPQSLVDLREILLYIAKERPIAAQRFVETLRAKCTQLARTPLIGSSRNELSLGLRAFSVGNYVIYYHPLDSGIRVERVLHGRRDVTAQFGPR